MTAIAYMMHFVGDLLGVEEEFNLCTGTLNEIKDYCHQIHQKIILPCLNQDPPTELSQYMSRNMLEGASIITPVIYFGAFKAWTFERLDVSEQRLKSLESNMESSFERFIYHLAVFVFEKLLVWKWSRWVLTICLNYLMKLNIACANYLKSYNISKYYKKHGKEVGKKTWKIAHDRMGDINKLKMKIKLS